MRCTFLLSLLLASCAVGPDYKEPDAKLGASFKTAGFTDPPPQGSWWSLFDDPQLAKLVRMADQDGPSVRAALARYDQARHTLGIANADAYPSVTADAYGRRRSDSGNSNFSSGNYDEYRAALNLSWEIDFWGRVRRQIQEAAANLEAADFDYQAAALSLRGEVTRAYLSLRFADAEIALLEQTSQLRAEARRLMKTRFEGGASSRIDHERAITEHESVRAELEQLRAERGRFENALAALTGRSASQFRIAPNGSRPHIPRVPASVPDSLLRRRPDIAAAERRLAASNERIGFVLASSLPRLSLTGEGGVSSLKASSLFDPTSQLWSLGPELTTPIFRGGLGVQSTLRAEAVYTEALEDYRETLVRAVEETENALNSNHHLARAADARERGSASAETVANLSRKRFEGGVADYFEVVDAERTALAEQRAALSIGLARALAAANLIQALGGGWQR